MYTERYWDVYNLIPDCNQAVAAESFMNGLDPSSPMFRDLSRNPPKSMSELMTIIEKDCMHEEAVAEHVNPKVIDSAKLLSGSSVVKKQVANVKSGGQGGSAHKNVPIAQQPQQQHAQQQPFRSQTRWEPRPDEYTAETTVFIVPIYQLLSTIGRLPFFRWPTEMMGTTNARTGHCSFHNEHGHYTTRCGPFKRHLEDLAAARHLNQWIDTRHTPLPPPPPERERLVGIIHGIISETKATELRTEIDKAIAERAVCSIVVPVKRKYEDPHIYQGGFSRRSNSPHGCPGCYCFDR